MQIANDRIFLIKEYEEAPEDTLFTQKTVAAIRNCSNATLEKERWAGKGIPFRKFGTSVRYCKTDIKKWLDLHRSFKSTTQAQYFSENNIN